ncbi:hypothetical protein [Lysobacter sp. TAB13]|uniref:hypothetical protein n=1 Tax=Lysobacter sp. TAB13 TaxID=3233065 RepID=UPI003F99248B
MPLGIPDDEYGPPPADLAALLRLNAAQDDGLDEALSELGCRLLAPDDAPTLLNPGSYMSQDELDDPSIAAGIVATEQVCALISFFVEDEESNLFGYWHGPEGAAMADAAIVKYDNEGQFALLQGRGLVEALIGDRVFDDDEAFAEHADRFDEIGIAVTNRSWEELASPDPATKPDELHAVLYERAEADQTST